MSKSNSKPCRNLGPWCHIPGLGLKARMTGSGAIERNLSQEQRRKMTETLVTKFFKENADVINASFENE